MVFYCTFWVVADNVYLCLQGSKNQIWGKNKSVHIERVMIGVHFLFAVVVILIITYLYVNQQNLMDHCHITTNKKTSVPVNFVRFKQTFIANRCRYWKLMVYLKSAKCYIRIHKSDSSAQTYVLTNLLESSSCIAGRCPDLFVYPYKPLAGPLGWLQLKDRMWLYYLTSTN